MTAAAAGEDGGHALFQRAASEWAESAAAGRVGRVKRRSRSHLRTWSWKMGRSTWPPRLGT